LAKAGRQILFFTLAKAGLLSFFPLAKASGKLASGEELMACRLPPNRGLGFQMAK